MLKIVDIFECDLRDIKSERKERFLRDSAAFSTDGAHPMPQLIVTVAATHAGLMTRNKAFYRPDSMKASLDTFLHPFAKPVQVHHSDHVDPVGRVRAVRYVDISHKYVDPLREFRNHFAGKTFLDAKSSNEKSFDQVNWILKNMQGMKDYQGLGYGELDLHISDPKTAERILDERYLTVSVGFSTTEAYCSQCKQDWAGNDGPCEHTPGTMYDEVPMVLIPSNFLYEEVSWVNNPADPHAQVIKVSQTGSPALETVSMPAGQNHDSAILPILLGVSSEGIYRLDSYRDVEDAKAQEIMNAMKKTDLGAPTPGNPQPQPGGAGAPSGGRPVPEQSPTKTKCTTCKKSMANCSCADKGQKMERNEAELCETCQGKDDADLCDACKDRAAGQTEANKKKKKMETGNDEAELCDACKDKDEADLCDACKAKKKMKDAGAMAQDPTDQLPDDFPGSKPVKMKKARKPALAKNNPKPKNKTADPSHDETDEYEYIELAEDAEVPEGYELVADEVEITDQAIVADDFYDNFMAPILDEIGAGDSKLSTEKRKGLKASTFCGPGRSFPVPDCAHVTAARRLIGRYKGGDKSKIMACVNRKAKSLGCDSKKDMFEPIDVVLVDPKGEEKEIKVRISDIDDFKVVVHTVGTEVFDANKDKLYEIGKLLDMNTEQVDSFAKDQPGRMEETPIEEVIDKIENISTMEFNDTFVDNFISQVKSMTEEARTDFIQKLHDKMIEAGFLPNYDEEYNELVDEVATLREKIARLTAANRDLYVARQTQLAETIVQIKESLKKPGFEELDENARTLKVTELTIRSIDSLKDALCDVTSEITGAKATQPELDADATGQPGSLDLEPDNKQVQETEGKVPFDPTAVRDMDDSTYQLARRLHESFRGDKR